MKKYIALVPDTMMVGGAALLSYGTGVLHPAAGFITAGVLMLVGGVIAARTVETRKAVE